jgi:hypothetical protein
MASYREMDAVAREQPAQPLPTPSRTLARLIASNLFANIGKDIHRTPESEIEEPKFGTSAKSLKDWRATADEDGHYCLAVAL